MTISIEATPFPSQIMTKRFFESVATSSHPAEEILKQLDLYGIEWYLTGKGNLLIKYWQVGAEDFVPGEYVAKLRENGPVVNEANALEWVSKQLLELKKKYAGKWIAVVDNQVAAASDNLPDLMQQVRQLAIEHPFVTEIPARPLVWTTAYAYKGI